MLLLHLLPLLLAVGCGAGSARCHSRHCAAAATAPAAAAAAAVAPGSRLLQRGVHALTAGQGRGQRVDKQGLRLKRLQRPPGCSAGAGQERKGPS